jgi:Bacterial Ig-like domain
VEPQPDVPGLDELGLPAARGWTVIYRGGARAPGTTLTFAAGLRDGVASVRRRYVWTLSDASVVVDREQADVGAISSRRPVQLAVRLPDVAPAAHDLTLDIITSTGLRTAVRWPVTVPEQRVDARLECRPSRARRGETLTATIHNDGPTELITGHCYAIDRRESDRWIAVDPFDGEEGAWPAVGLIVQPGGTLDQAVHVPRSTEPGVHRIVKHVSAEAAGIQDAAVIATFHVLADVAH